MATLVQLAGFPILFPLYVIFPTTKQTTTVNQDQQSTDKKPSTLKLIVVYTGLGLLLAADCMLYSIGLLYLPVSTYSIICASQLAFNALFSFFLNSQKFTPYIVNSLVLLTVSAVMLVLQGDDDSSPTQHVSRGKYIIGFVCTVGASAGYGFLLPLNQLVFSKVLRSDSIRAILDMIVYQSLVATVAVVVGLFVSGDSKTIKAEMDDYTLGSVSYLMTLIWIALNWQIFSVGSMKLILDVSSLFSNVISTLGLPLVPILAVFIFHDRINGGKVVAMVLAIWGFVSYGYQYYLDDRNTSNRGHEEEQNNA